MAYLSDVKNRLGEEVVDAMIDHSMDERFPSDKLSSFAQYLGENMESNLIFGNHERRKKDGADGLKAILCDWYSEELFDITTDAALEKLVAALELPDINVKPLAAVIKNIKEHKRGQSRENPNTPKISNSIYISCGFVVLLAIILYTGKEWIMDMLACWIWIYWNVRC